MQNKQLRFTIFALILVAAVIIVALPFFQNNKLRNVTSLLRNTESTSAAEDQKNKAEEIKKITLELLTSIKKETSSSSDITNNLSSLALKRKELLKELLQTNPSEALKLSIPFKIKKDLPSDIKELIENEVTVEGNLEHLYSDDFTNKLASHIFSLNTSDGKRYKMFFSDKRVEKIPSGTKIKVSGIELDNIVASQAPQNGNVLGAQSVAGTTSTIKKLAVLLVNYKTAPVQPYTTNEIKQKIFTQSNSVRAYYQEASHGTWSIEGKTNSDGDVYGWYSISGNNCDSYSVSTAADAAAKSAGVDLNGYTNIMYITAGNTSCSNALGELSGARSWLSLPADPTYFPLISDAAHELGHNFGESHSNAYLCYDSNNNQVAISDNCINMEYGDPFDVMGGTYGGLIFNNFHQGRLNLFNRISNTQTVTVDGTYSLEPIEATPSGIQALRIARDSGSYYYLEYRQPIGYFDTIGTYFGNWMHQPVFEGVTIRIASDYSNASSPLLIDSKPALTQHLAQLDDASLREGETFFDSSKGIKITTIATSTAEAKVQITLGSQACTRANPTLSISPQAQWGKAGESLSYSYTLTNNDSSNCGSSSFLVETNTPAGFSQTPSSYTEALAPKASTVRNFSILSGAAAPDGFYTIMLKVTNSQSSQYYATSSVNYNVQNTINPSPSGTPLVTSAPTISVISPTDGSTLPKKGSFKISVTATDPDGMKEIIVTIDNGVVKNCPATTSCQASLKSSSLSSGAHLISATAKDSNGMVSTKTIQVTI